MDQIGLSQTEAKKLLSKHGYNEIADTSPFSPFKIFLRQLRGNFLLYTLCVAAILSLLIGKPTTGYSIIGVVIIIIFTSFLQEYRAEKAVKALKNLVVPFSKVMREGHLRQIPSRELVVGDIILLQTGDKIPADCIIVEENSLRVDESVLTGESEAVEKTADVDKNNLDSVSKLFMGTHITEGKCTGEVLKTGMETEFGKIAQMVSSTDKDMPLQKKVDKIAKYMASVAITTAVLNGLLLISGLESINTFSLIEIFTIVIALAVSAIPEGLPVVLTTTLATGAYRMAKRNAVVNRMSVIETLGETTVICSDKTGTLTTGEMTATKIYCNNSMYDITGVGYSEKGDFYLDDNLVAKEKDETINLLMQSSLICNDADHEFHPKQHKHTGSPTEIALMTMANKWGFHKENLKGERIDEIPFNSEHKKMFVLYEEVKTKKVFAKGAPEYLLKDCKFLQIDGKVKPLGIAERNRITIKNNEFALSGLRSICLAYKVFDSSEEMSSNLIFLGLVGVQDPPRLEVAESIKTCLSAGIKVKMITGDNLQTACTIANKVGIIGKSIDGQNIDTLNDSELLKIVEETAIYARVKPEHKLRIVRALKHNGEIVAMTGDGINDAPALKEAHVGIAMGKNGTDVTRSVADITLKDDDFSTIVSAISEGRTIFSNIRKFVTFQLSCNFAQLAIIFIGTALGLPLPLLALQILFINLITDTLASISLGFNPPSAYVMNAPPRKKSELIDKKSIKWIIALGSIIVFGTLGIYYFALKATGWNVELSRTTGFLALTFFATFNAFNFQSFHIPVVKTPFFANKFLAYSLLLSLLGAYLIVNSPLGIFFETVPLPPNYWIIVIVMPLSIILLTDFAKFAMAKKVK